jgi:hypothetical protein
MTDAAEYGWAEHFLQRLRTRVVVALKLAKGGLEYRAQRGRWLRY